MPNIQPEINAFNSAVYGKDVRTAIVNLANKLNTDLDTALEQEFVEVDPTLSIRGAGADASVVGDELQLLKNKTSRLENNKAEVDDNIAYKDLDPSDYDNKFANVNVSCLSAKNSNFADLPGSGEYVLLNARYSYNYNVQFALGYAASDKNFYWRIVNRNDHTVFVDWTTDNLNLDTSLSVTGAAADAAAVGTALAAKATVQDPQFVGKLAQNLRAGLTVGDYATSMSYLGGATGVASAAFNVGCVASGDSSCAMGAYSEAKAMGSFAHGRYTDASSEYQHVEGKMNIVDSNNTYAHIVGNGTKAPGISGEITRSNAYTLDWSGNGWYAGTVKVGGTSYADAAEVATKSYVDSAINTAISSSIGGSY